jgi:hypothetical protein
MGLGVGIAKGIYEGKYGGYIAEVPGTHGQGRGVGIPCVKAPATTGIVKPFVQSLPNLYISQTILRHLADN